MNDPTIKELAEADPTQARIAKMLKEPGGVDAFFQELRARAVDSKPLSDEEALTALAAIPSDDVDVVAVAHRFAGPIDGYYGGGAVNARRSQVLFWLMARLRIHARHGSLQAYRKHVATSAVEALSQVELSVAFAEQFSAYYGKPADRLTYDEVTAVVPLMQE